MVDHTTIAIIEMYCVVNYAKICSSTTIIENLVPGELY